MDVLKELHAEEKKMLIVLNKIDLIAPARRAQVAAHFDKPVLVSLHTGEGVDELGDRLSEMMLERTVRLKLRLPQSEFGLMSVIHQQGKLLHQEYEDNDVLIDTVLPRRFEAQFLPFVIGGAPQRKREAWEQ
jgi:GTP-binding protein HflX